MVRKVPCSGSRQRLWRYTYSSTIAPDYTVDVTGGSVTKVALRKVKAAHARGNRDLQLSMSGLAFTLVKLAKTPQMVKGDLKLDWTKFQKEYKPQVKEDLIELISDFSTKQVGKCKIKCGRMDCLTTGATAPNQ